MSAPALLSRSSLPKGPPWVHLSYAEVPQPAVPKTFFSGGAGGLPRRLALLADDGKLSFEEFNAYFADGILTTEELQELFYSIDGRQNNNLDTDKLSDYFSQHLGEYINVLSALESLNIAILKAMDKTKEEYQGSSVLGQFVTRFMLRETSSQLLSLQRSLQCAMEAVEDSCQATPPLPAPGKKPRSIEQKTYK
uniref:N-terminal EF-hand calcium binding protein 3 n=1 Tax=Seriola dumerili TaxID=41447 RepID=A0A3B4VPI8_SERDU